MKKFYESALFGLILFFIYFSVLYALFGKYGFIIPFVILIFTISLSVIGSFIFLASKMIKYLISKGVSKDEMAKKINDKVFMSEMNDCVSKVRLSWFIRGASIITIIGVIVYEFILNYDYWFLIFN